jgi:hypothetical protein
MNLKLVIVFFWQSIDLKDKGKKLVGQEDQQGELE